eukprot:1155679-Pelagomonas_calceolata.AAC.4
MEKARLSTKEAEYEAQIDKAVEEHSQVGRCPAVYVALATLMANPSAHCNHRLPSRAQGWEMDINQVRSVLSLRGPKKVAALAGVVRTAQFMHRYTSELSSRDERLQNLQRAWWEKYMGNPKQKKEAEDMRQAFEVGLKAQLFVQAMLILPPLQSLRAATSFKL